MQVIQSDEGYKVWRKNKLVGFVDEKDVLHGIDENTGYSVEICPIGHTGEIQPLLKKWLKSQNTKV